MYATYAGNLHDSDAKCMEEVWEPATFCGEWGSIMAKKVTIADQILRLLSEGNKWADEIVAGVSAQPASIRACLGELVRQGAILRIKRGVYGKKEVPGARGAVENLRKTSDNVETINQLLNFYDEVLDDFARRIRTVDWTEVGTRADVIKTLGWLTEVIDGLMHRWYVVHRGYDANPYQAAADVAQKVSAANASGREREVSAYEIISWESEKETLAEAIARHEKEQKGKS